MAVVIRVGAKANEKKVRLEIDARKSLNGDVMIFDHGDIDIVLSSTKNKVVIFITNAPRRSYVIADQLNNFGLSKIFYDEIVSSGEITWLSLKKNYERKKCFMIGPPRDFHLDEGLDIEIVEDPSKGVDIIINT